MKCTYSECNSNTEMDPPKIMVTIHDFEKGTGIGYYDRHECALADVKATLEFMTENPKIEGAPGAFDKEPVFVENAVEHDPGTVIDVGLEINSPQPRYDAKKYQKAGQTAEYISSAILETAEGVWRMRDQVWSLETTENVLSETDNGFKIPYTRRTYTLEGTDFVAEIGYNDTAVWVKFPNLDEAWNLNVDPDKFNRRNHNQWIIQHVEVLVSNANQVAPAANNNPAVEDAVADGLAEANAGVPGPFDI